MTRPHHAPPQLVAAVALFGSLALSACSLSSSAPAPRRDDLRIPLYGSVLTVDPTLAETPSSLFVASLLYSGLVKYGPDLHVIPDLAVSIPTISDDGRAYTFTVRQDARFSDGRHCTAADVAYSLARALSPGVHSPLARHYLGQIEGAAAVERGETTSLSGVQVTDRLTVRIRLTRPDASFLDKLALPVAAVVDRRTLGFYPRRSWTAPPAGTGPWAILQRLSQGGLILKPRRHFYGGSLQLKELRLLPVATASKAIDLYRRGLVDVAQVPAGEYPRLSERADFHDSASLDAYYALPAAGDGAVSLAAHLNRDQLIRDSTSALSPLTEIVPPAVPDYVSSTPSLEAGTADGGVTARVELGSSWDPTAHLLGRALGRQWPEAHPGTVVRVVHLASLLPDPAAWLRVVFQQTPSRWYRRIMARSARLTTDPVTRMSAYSRAETWALEEGLVIPLASGNVAYLIKPRVQSLQVTPSGIMPANNSWASVSVT